MVGRVCPSAPFGSLAKSRRAGTDAPYLRELSQRWLRAFSVLELLVAISLLAVIVIGLLAMFNQTQKAFRGGMAQTDVMESGRIAMQFLTREIQQIAATEIDAANLIAWTPSRAIDSSTMSLPNNRERTNHLQDITFVTRVNDEWTATAYRISNPVDGAGALYRWTGKYPSADFISLSNLCATAVGFLGPTSDFDFIADGVAHFAATAYDTNGLRMVSNDLVVNNPGAGFSFPSNQLPAFLALELGVLEQKTVAQFNAKAPGARVPWLTDQANRMHLFIQRIPIRNAP